MLSSTATTLDASSTKQAGVCCTNCSLHVGAECGWGLVGTWGNLGLLEASEELLVCRVDLHEAAVEVAVARTACALQAQLDIGPGELLGMATCVAGWADAHQ